MRLAWGRTLVRPRTLLAAAFGAAAMVLALSQAAGAETRFTDPTGDSNGAPDVTNVDVSNDVVAGRIIVWVYTPNREDLSAADSIGVLLDTDLNRSTGHTQLGGIEFLIAFQGSATLSRWNGTTYAQVAAPSLKADYISELKALRIEIHPNDLGGTLAAFNFWILSLTGQNTDVAPDGLALWSYSLTTGPLKLSSSVFTMTPNPPRAGKVFTASMFALRDDITEFTTEGTVTCTLRVGAKTIRATLKGFVGGKATCRWRIPKATGGKRVAGSIAVGFGGATVKRAFAARVRR